MIIRCPPTSQTPTQWLKIRAGPTGPFPGPCAHTQQWKLQGPPKGSLQPLIIAFSLNLTFCFGHLTFLWSNCFATQAPQGGCSPWSFP